MIQGKASVHEIPAFSGNICAHRCTYKAFCDRCHHIDVLLSFALCEFDAIDIYNYHKSTGKGVNCRHLAIAFNEMYLSMGIKSRYVTCMPKDPNDNDCHVINSVYSQQLNK